MLQFWLLRWCLLAVLCGVRGDTFKGRNGTSGGGGHEQHHEHEHPRPTATTGFYASPSPFPNRSIVIDSRWFGDPPGGVEALIQLSLAMVAATSPEHVFVSGYRGLRYHDKWLKVYGDRLVWRVKPIDDLQAGDVFIINEAIECPVVAPGVLVYAYLLANYRGCRGDSIHYLSHNHHLLTFETLVLPRERLIQPYLGPGMISMAHQRGLQHDGSILYSKLSHRGRKTNLVLVDDDVPESVKRLLQRVAESLGGKVKVLAGLKTDQMVEAYESAKVAFDWCMRGSERCMYEAALFGAAVVTNRCETGDDFLDMPIPARYLVNHTDDTSRQSDATNEALYNQSFPPYLRLQADLTAAISHVFDNYWEVLDDFEPLRRSVISRTPASMIKESVRFLASLDEKDNALSKRKCVGCR